MAEQCSNWIFEIKSEQPPKQGNEKKEHQESCFHLSPKELMVYKVLFERE